MIHSKRRQFETKISGGEPKIAKTNRTWTNETAKIENFRNLVLINVAYLCGVLGEIKPKNVKKNYQSL